MLTIYKYSVNPFGTGSQSLALTKGAIFLHVALQNDSDPQVWVELEKNRVFETRFIQVFGTGHDIPDTAEYIGTFQQEPFVWHLYEVIEE